jgi:hypothetical protein
MRRIGLIVLCVTLMASPAFAAKDKKSTDKTKGEASEKLKLQKEKIEEIKDSEWDVTLISGNGKNQKTEQDKLVFSGRRVILKSFEKRFPAVGYTVTTKDDGTAQWENYQENDKGSLSILGSWDGDVMKGGVVEVSADGKQSTAYSFTSKRLPVPADAKEGKAAASADESVPTPSKVLVSKEV